MKRVEMYGDQRELIAKIVATSDNGQSAVIIPGRLLPTLQKLIDDYDRANHEDSP